MTPCARWLQIAAYHRDHMQRMIRRGLTYGASGMAALVEVAMANAVGEASR
jgi:hypothetical protein